VVELRSIRHSWKTMARKRKKVWASKAERDAWEAHVDGTVRTLRELVEKGRAELERKRAATDPSR
jgi:hypothetical protein